MPGQRENPAPGAFRLHAPEGQEPVQSGHRGLRRRPRLGSHVLSAWEQMWRGRARGCGQGLGHCRWTRGRLVGSAAPVPARESPGHKDRLAGTSVPSTPLTQFLPQGRLPTQEHTGVGKGVRGRRGIKLMSETWIPVAACVGRKTGGPPWGPAAPAPQLWEGRWPAWGSDGGPTLLAEVPASPEAEDVWLGLEPGPSCLGFLRDDEATPSPAERPAPQPGQPC